MPHSLDAHVDAVRAFNRFWTAQIGALDAAHLATTYSLTEARVLFELAHREKSEVGELRGELGLDAGYMSRILARFKEDKLVAIQVSQGDRRRQLATLTAKGKRAFAALDARAADAVRGLLAKVPSGGHAPLVAAMEEIRGLLDPKAKSERPIVLRPPRAGDLGWLVERHGAIYAAEYAWNDAFEGLVARIVADFVDERDHAREAAFIAEMAGERVGCVLCVKKNDATAQLRLLLVEPKARGNGIGRLLVDECVRFARGAGYKKMTLWTNDVLREARRLYERAGFRLAREEKHRSFGKELVGQTWTLDLRRTSGVTTRHSSE